MWRSLRPAVHILCSRNSRAPAPAPPSCIVRSCKCRCSSEAIATVPDEAPSSPRAPSPPEALLCIESRHPRRRSSHLEELGHLRRGGGRGIASGFDVPNLRVAAGNRSAHVAPTCLHPNASAAAGHRKRARCRPLAARRKRAAATVPEHAPTTLLQAPLPPSAAPPPSHASPFGGVALHKEAHTKVLVNTAPKSGGATFWGPKSSQYV